MFRVLLTLSHEVLYSLPRLGLSLLSCLLARLLNCLPVGLSLAHVLILSLAPHLLARSLPCLFTGTRLFSTFFL
jgi:hypothetical protein